MAEVTKFTFEVPPELRRLMDKHPEVNWSAVFRQSIHRQARAAELARRTLEDESDPRVRAVAALAKRRVGERYRDLAKARKRPARRK